MKIEYLHASKYGNGAMVVQEFREQMADKGVTVRVHHIREAKQRELPAADQYLFSSPGRFGKPIREMRQFLKEVELPPGTKYAILTPRRPRIRTRPGTCPPTRKWPGGSASA